MIPLFSVDQVRNADSFAVKELKIPGEILMENASISIKNAIFEKYPYIDLSYRFGIICGKGNNGGDGFALARHLLIKGFDVSVISLAGERELKGDALLNFRITKNLIESYNNSEFKIFSSLRDLNRLNECEIIVDAILGTGVKGELKAPYRNIIEKLNSISALKVAVDSPTGLNLVNACGDCIYKADLTVTLAALKEGLFYEKGRVFSGEIRRGSIGMGMKFFESLETEKYLVEPEDAMDLLPRKESDLHKYSAGKLLVIAGSSHLPGAAVYTINAAMMSGAGAGFLAFPESIKSLAQSQMNSAVVLSYNDNEKGVLDLPNTAELSSKIEWADVIAIGPGLGRMEGTKNAVAKILKSFSDKIFVIDADAIYALGNENYKKIDLSGNVITPHHGEFSELLGVSSDELKKNLIKYGRQFAIDTDAYLVLKGAPTLIFNPSGEVFFNSSGNSGLAKFGSGDVLTGIIASFIAQSNNVEGSAIAGVYTHGLTADLLLKNESEFGITPNKLIDHFPHTIKFLRKSVV